MEQHLIQKRQFKKKMQKRPLKKKMNFDFLEEEPKKMQEEQKKSNTDDTILGIKMSESLKDYVVRSYTKCKRNKKNEKIMTKLLKEVIEEAKELGDVLFRDWDNYPLPLLPYEKIQKNTVKLENNQFSNFGNNFDPRGNPFLAQTQNYPNNSYYNNYDNYGLNTNINQNIQENAFKKKFGKKKKKIDFLISKEEQAKLRESLARQGKNKKIPESQRTKYLDANEYLNKVKSSINMDDANAQMILNNRLKIVGTSQALEKKYFRLTEFPDPSTVRPEHVLKESLKHILKRYENGEVDKRFILDQFRSIRLDLNIQRIRNEFTAKVYEENALFCLRIGDADQFNKCQMQLYELYHTGGINGRKYEFLMYRILYLTLNSEKNVLNRFLKEQEIDDLDTMPVKKVLELKKALCIGNIDFVFNQLIEGFEGTRFLLKLFLEKLRIWALQIMAKSYGKSIGLEYVKSKLHFENFERMNEFLEEKECVLDKNQGLLMLKLSRAKLMSNPKMLEGFD